MSEEKNGHNDLLREIEALLFAAPQPLRVNEIAKALFKDGAAARGEAQIKQALKNLEAEYCRRGVNLVRRGEAYAFRTAADLSYIFTREKIEAKALSRAARETLAIIAYHQPISRAELEDIRGVETAKGILDILLETGWAVIKGRRDSPGRPLLYGTSAAFLDYFNLPSLKDLPGLKELRGMGFLQADFGREHTENGEINGKTA